MAEDLIVNGWLNPALIKEWSIDSAIDAIRAELHSFSDVTIKIKDGGGHIDATWMRRSRRVLWNASSSSGHKTAQEAVDTLKRGIFL